jgi:hypothetical protein
MFEGDVNTYKDAVRKTPITANLLLGSRCSLQTNGTGIVRMIASMTKSDTDCAYVSICVSMHFSFNSAPADAHQMLT